MTGFHSHAFARGRRQHSAGFTLLEVLVASALLVICTGAILQSLAQSNRYAMLSRLQTAASGAAQNQIDLILSDGPFNPQQGQIPPSLQTGVQNQGTSTAPSVPIYVDPATGNPVVLGWMTSTVTDMGASLNGQNVTIYRGDVIVSYNYRGRNYTVSMSTLRTSDT